MHMATHIMCYCQKLVCNGFFCVIYWVINEEAKWCSQIMPVKVSNPHWLTGHCRNILKSPSECESMSCTVVNLCLLFGHLLHGKLMYPYFKLSLVFNSWNYVIMLINKNE